MHITRRVVITGAVSLFPTIAPRSTSAASTEQTEFMIEAVKQLRGYLQLPDSRDAIRKLPTRLSQRPPTIRLETVCLPIAFADFDMWYIPSFIKWSPNEGQKLPDVTVPKGFCCDLASVP